jgi:hypothetical protein
MIDIDKKVLMQLSKEQLIYLLEQFEHSACLISETCVDVSKGNINAKMQSQKSATTVILFQT